MSTALENFAAQQELHNLIVGSAIAIDRGINHRVILFVEEAPDAE